MKTPSLVGKRATRTDGLEKVTGRATYGVDVKLPGMLYAQVLPAPLAHARILRIDLDKARNLPGVKAVVSGKDLAQGLYGLAIKDRPILPSDRVRYLTEEVAAIAATDEDIVQEALGLIEVEYEELTAIFDPTEAMEPGAPLVHPRLAAYHVRGGMGRPVPDSNVCRHFKLRKGNLQEGFRESSLVLQETFRVPMIHHCYLEPYAAVAWARPSGITVWSNAQSPYRVRDDVADALKMPLNRIRVINTKVGGGFGGKSGARIEPLCAALSQITGRPVKMVQSRAQAFTSSISRHPVVVTVKAGVKRNGQLAALEMKLVWDTGAYSDLGPAVCYSAGYSATGPYVIPHVKVDSYCVYTNNPVAGAFRGFGAPQTAWAVESMMDMLAHELSVDPLEFRMRNAAQEGSTSATGEVLHSVGARDCLQLASQTLNWSTRPSRGRGKGMALIHKFTRSFAPSCAFVKLNEDGTLGLATSAIDVGQGCDTILAQIAAQEFGLQIDDVTLAQPDTDATPFDVGSISSRITFHMGNAVRLAAADAKGQIFKLAASLLEANPDDLELADRRVFVRGTPEKGMSLAELAALSHTFRSGPILGRGSYLPEGIIPLDPETGQSARPTPFWMYGAQATEVEVDEETGQIDLVRIAAAHDVGCAINPTNVEAQIQGGVVTGMGSALLEEMVLESGRVLNPSFMDYLLPSSLDVPPIETSIVEAPHKDGPYGAKGVGEACNPPTAPAIANAVFAACGARIKELPLTPEKLLRALRAKK